MRVSIQGDSYSDHFSFDVKVWDDTVEPLNKGPNHVHCKELSSSWSVPLQWELDRCESEMLLRGGPSNLLYNHRHLCSKDLNSKA